MCSDNEKKKRSFRSSKKWLSFRHNCVVDSKSKDYITGNKLRKGFELHHMDLNPEHYENLENKDNFLCLNKQTHRYLHWLYNYYKNDKKVIDRLVEILEKMVEINP